MNYTRNEVCKSLRNNKFTGFACTCSKWKIIRDPRSMQYTVCSLQLFFRVEIPIGVTMKIIIFWGVTPCSLVDRYQCFEEICYIHFLSKYRDNRFLRNLAGYVPNYTASRSRRSYLNCRFFCELRYDNVSSCNIRRRTVLLSWKLNDDLEMIGKEATTVWSRYYRHGPGGTKENHEPPRSR
jgi:hypothetical protein